jgi:DNA sulfur modification protein DndD
MADRLLIKKMDISNCGGFDGNHSIEFSSDPEKNFTIIIGTSGRGKSTIFKLIHWCLYGEHFEKKDEDTATEEGIVNLPQLESLKEGDNVTGKVVLRINNQDGERYVLERTIIATKNSEQSRIKFDENNNSKIDSGIQTETSCKLKMKDKRGNDIWEKNTDVIDDEIRKNLPIPLKDFFLFDGENLVNFRTKAGSSRLIQDGIEKISGLNVLDSLIDDVEYAYTRINSSVQGKTITSKGMGNKVNNLKNQLDELKEDKREKEKDHDNKDKLLENTIEQISSSKEGKRIEDQIKTEDKSLREAGKQEKKNVKETHDFLFEKLPLVLISDTLKESEKLFADLEARNLIPPSMTREALDKILLEKSCICGAEFKENDAVWDTLHEIKKAILDKDTTQGITAGRTLISQMVDMANIVDVENKFLELQSNSTDVDRIIQESTSKRNLLLEEQQTIGKVKGLNYDELVQLRKDLQVDVAGLASEISDIEENIIQKEDQLKEANTEYHLKLAHEGKHTTELSKVSILNAIRKYSKKKRNEIIEQLRIKTEKFTGEYFKSSAPQASEFANNPPDGPGCVRITKNYDISALSQNEKEKELSKGQAHVLGLSYVAGCRQITNTDTFLFIDSPLHNISGDERNEITQVLAKNLPDVQIVLFVTDTEYLSGDVEGAKPVREYLNPQTKVWKEWIINVTCIECKDVILSKSDTNERELVCKNCNKTYDRKLDPTGRRLITEYERNV